jgi:2-dehydro-3-deoxygluconokinase
MQKSIPTFDVTTFGETMLRLSVPPGERLEAAHRLDLRPGGAESNVVTLLARLGLKSAWCGALPESALGRLAANHLRMAGVNLEGVVWCTHGRMGLYFVEFAVPPRATQVIYDRANSCAARMTQEQMHWAHLLDARLLHLTGITPALSGECAHLTAEAIRRAQAAGVTVSFDVNYRTRLWSASDAAHAIGRLIDGVDLLFCSRADAERLFAIDGLPEDAVRRLADRANAAITVMSIGAEGVVAWDGVSLRRQAAVETSVIDRPGAGDALAAGVLFGWLQGDLDLGLRYGVTLAALALSQMGDIVITSREEVESLLAMDGGILR